MNIKRSKKYEAWSMRLMYVLFFLFTSYSLLLISAPALAAETPYTLLAPIPLEGANSEPTEETTPGLYIKGVFMLIIALAGGLAVVTIIYGGIQYMSTDAFTGKSEAKDTILHAIWGLLLVISAWLILSTINPELVNINLDISPVSQTPNTNTPPNITSCLSPCVTVSVPHKPAPQGCAAPGPCTINADLDAKLQKLHELDNLFVTESYPPTVTHKSPCHGNGTCVDAIGAALMTPTNALKMVNDAKGLGLHVLVEVANANRVKAMVDAGIPASQVIITDGNGEHYHITLIR